MASSQSQIPTISCYFSGKDSCNARIDQKKNDNSKHEIVQTVNVINSVKLQRTKCVDKIISFFKLEERPNKEDCSRKEQCIYFLIIWILIAMFIVSLSGFFIVWFTDYYESSLQSNLVLANGTKAKQWWQKTPIYPLMKIYIFNYTNAEAYLSGKENILRLQELGPITYREMSEKVDLVHHEDGTITYKEKKHYEYVSELSDISLDSIVTVPNIPFIIADHKVKQMSVWEKSATKFTIRLTSPKPHPYRVLTINEFLWGYDDPIMDLYKIQTFFTSIVSDTPLIIEKFGLLAMKNGTSPDNYTIYSGEGDIKKLGVVKMYNGQNKMKHYDDDECNYINGTDGSQFPPHLMDKKATLHIYLKPLCRRFPLDYEKEVTVFESRIPAWRYRPPKDVFLHPNENSYCFCNKSASECPPNGVFNVSKCLDDMPLLSSFPHFYLGDPHLYENFEGLQPKEELHETYADIHPKLAFPLNGVSRFQINIELPQKPEFEQFQPFIDKRNREFRHTYNMLPVVWMEITGGEIPREFQEIIYHSTFTVNVFESNIRYATLIFVILSLLLLVIVFIWTQKKPGNEKLPVVTYVHETVHMT